MTISLTLGKELGWFSCIQMGSTMWINYVYFSSIAWTN